MRLIIMLAITTLFIVTVPLVLLGCDDNTRQAIKQYRENQRNGNVPG